MPPFAWAQQQIVQLVYRCLIARMLQGRHIQVFNNGRSRNNWIKYLTEAGKTIDWLAGYAET